MNNKSMVRSYVYLDMHMVLLYFQQQIQVSKNVLKPLKNIDKYVMVNIKQTKIMDSDKGL